MNAYRTWDELTPIERLLVGYEYPGVDYERFEWRFIDTPDRPTPFRVERRAEETVGA